MSPLDEVTHRKALWAAFVVPVGISGIVMVSATLVVFSLESQDVQRRRVKEPLFLREASSSSSADVESEAAPLSTTSRTPPTETKRDSPSKRRRGFSPVLDSEPPTGSSSKSTESSTDTTGAEISDEDRTKRTRALRSVRKSLGIFGGRRKGRKNRDKTENRGTAGAGTQ